jgi:hypothetical protein
MSPRRDPYFGRYALTVITAAVVVVILGLTAIWYFFEAGGATSPTSPLRDLLGKARGLAPNQAMLYYTRDGRQLVGTVTNLGRAETSPGERAQQIVQRLIAGHDSAFLKSPVPRGTQVKSVFVNDTIAIVNLSKEFIDRMGPSVDDELLAVFSIVNSLLYNIETIEAVQILVEGERVPTARGTVDLESPLIANAALNRPA